MNPTINVLLGPIKDYKEHPLPNLLAYEYTGTKHEFQKHRPVVSINTDNPTIVGGIDLIHEYAQVISAFNLTQDDVVQIILNSIKYRLGAFELRFGNQIKSSLKAMNVNQDIDRALLTKKYKDSAMTAEFSLKEIFDELKSHHNDLFKMKMERYLIQTSDEGKDRNSVNQWVVLAPFKELIRYVESLAVIDKQLEFLEGFVEELRKHQDGLRIAAVLEILAAVIKRQKINEVGGINDFNALKHLNALLDNQLLSGFQRRILNGAEEQLQRGSWKPGVNELSKMFDEYKSMVLLEDDLNFPPPTRRDIYEEVTLEIQKFLARSLKQDMPGSSFLLDQNGKPLVYQFYSMAAATRPFIAVIIHRSGIPLRMAIKDKMNKQSLYDHVSHLGGTKLLAVINAPIAWVNEGSRFVYIQTIRDREITDFINEDLKRSSEEMQKRFFFALGVAMSEAHILGMSDRRRNLIISLRRLEQYDIKDLSKMENRAVFNIDRENALTPKFLKKAGENDISEAASVPVAWRNYVLPQDRDIFIKNLNFYLDGFREGYRETQKYFKDHRSAIERKVVQISEAEGSSLGPRILIRLNLSDERVDALKMKLKVEIQRLFKLPPSPSEDDLDEAMVSDAQTIANLNMDRAMAEPQLHKDNPFGDTLRKLLKGEAVTETSFRYRHILSEIGPEVERFVQSQYGENTQIKIAIAPYGSTFKGYASPSSDLEYFIYILSGLDGNPMFDRTSIRIKIREELNRLLEQKGIRGDPHIVILPLMNLSDVTAGQLSLISSEHLENFDLMQIFLPVAYADVSLIERLRGQVVRYFVDSGDEGKRAWQSLRNTYKEYVKIQQGDVDRKSHLAKWLEHQGIASADDFNKARAIELPDLDEMVKIYIPLKEYLKKKDDRAMNAKGGIDLTPTNMNLQTQNLGGAIKFHLDPAQLQQLQNAPGFVPVIINIQPLKDLSAFLGINQPQPQENLALKQFD